MIITVLPVPPVCIRPSVTMGASGTNEDDLTVKIGDIVYINQFIRNAIKKGNQAYNLMGNWEFLQTQVSRNKKKKIRITRKHQDNRQQPRLEIFPLFF